MDFLGSWQGLLWSLYCLLTGWIVGWIQTREPLIRKVKALESGLELDSVRKMERVLMLEEELRWAKAKVQAQESDLDRMQKKLVWSSGMDLPQQNMSYWRVEGPKLKQKVLDLEMELESLRSKTLWKE
jgi:hypothetical protein